MTATAPPPTVPGRPRRWPRRLARGLFALLFVGLPLLGAAGLATLWARSYRVEDTWELRHNGEGFDPATRVRRFTHGAVKAVASAGLLSVEATWWRDAETITDPDEAQRLLEEQEAARADPDPDDERGWGWWHRAEELADEPEPRSSLDALDAAQAGRGVRPPTNALALPRGDGFGRPVTYFAWTRSDLLVPHDSARAVAPFWGWMLPLAVPIVWWAWCPSGRVAPRLTLRRSLIATAGVALALTLLGRSSPVDHAVLTLMEFDAQIGYGPDPADSGRLIPIVVSLSQVGNDHTMTITPPHAARISRALGRLPILRALDLSGTPGPASIEAAMLPPGRPDLEALSLRESNADAATLARLAEFPRLRRLDLTRSLRVDDAALVHLRRLPGLADLALGHLRITDAGLDHLRGLPSLRRLDFRPLPYPGLVDKPPNRLTEPALRSLADSLPGLEELIRPDGTVLRPDRPGAGTPGPGHGP